MSWDFFVNLTLGRGYRGDCGQNIARRREKVESTKMLALKLNDGELKFGLMDNVQSIKLVNKAFYSKNA